MFHKLRRCAGAEAIMRVGQIEANVENSGLQIEACGGRAWYL
jgi:hypothetical protein